MKFRNINNTLIAACEASANYFDAIQGIELVDLFSKDGLRTLQQNKKLWPMLTDISHQVVWFESKHDTETWKHIITAAWRNQVFLHGIGGGMVAIPTSTSKLNKSEFAELIEAIYVFGSEKDVEWSEPALKAYESYREAA